MIDSRRNIKVLSAWVVILICLFISCSKFAHSEELDLPILEILNYSGNVLNLRIENAEKANGQFFLSVKQINSDYYCENESIKKEISKNDLTQELDNLFFGQSYECVLSYVENDLEVQTKYNFVVNEYGYSNWKTIDTLSQAYTDVYNIVPTANQSNNFYLAMLPHNGGSIYKINKEECYTELVEIPLIILYKNMLGSLGGLSFFAGSNGNGLYKNNVDNNKVEFIKNTNFLVAPSKTHFAFDALDKLYYNQDEVLYRLEINDNYSINKVDSLFPFEVSNIVKDCNCDNSTSGFVVVQDEDDYVVWEFNYANKEWSSLTSYPGGGSDNFLFSCQDDLIVMGGGRHEDLSIAQNNSIFKNKDIWTFNLESNEWKCEGIIPVDVGMYTSKMVEIDGKHWIASIDRIPNFVYVSFFDPLNRKY